MYSPGAPRNPYPQGPHSPFQDAAPDPTSTEEYRQAARAQGLKSLVRGGIATVLGGGIIAVVIFAVVDSGATEVNKGILVIPGLALFYGLIEATQGLYQAISCVEVRLRSEPRYPAEQRARINYIILFFVILFGSIGFAMLKSGSFGAAFGI
jgi:hypothetical protein